MALDNSHDVKRLWDARASDEGLTDEVVTLPDRNQRRLEIDVILRYLPNVQTLLDVGCGNGFSTSIFAQVVKKVIGIDYSEAMIERGKTAYGHISNLDFQVEDILKLSFPTSAFDAAISQRCLINLPTWRLQKKAIANIANVLKPGGYYLFQEGTRQGRERLNQVREHFGLPRMPTVQYNLDFDEERTWPYIKRYFDIVTVRRFGHYDLISRVVHPLLVDPEEPKYDAKINRIAARLSTYLEGAEDYSRQFLAILRRLAD